MCVVTGVGAASSVCYACHWRGMGRPKPTRPQPNTHSSVTSSGRARAGTARRPVTSPPGGGPTLLNRYWDGAGVKRKHAASHEGGRPTYFLNASLTFSPASLRLDFAWSPLPSFSALLSPVTLPTASLALPTRFWTLFFALSAPLTGSAPTSRESAPVCRTPRPVGTSRASRQNEPVVKTSETSPTTGWPR